MSPSASAAAPHIFGIRHHGPGSAQSLRKALEAMRPDILLVEGPPDAAEVLPLLAHPQMQPPVALLIYVPETPNLSVYYPFAIFSPEWQAIHYGLTSNIPVRFMDLPQAHQLAEAVQEARRRASQEEPPEAMPEEAQAQAPEQAEEPAATDDGQGEADPQPLPPDFQFPVPDPRADPLGFLAQAAGYSDGERWWEHMVEQRQNSAGVFEAILEAMTAARAEIPPLDDTAEARHEAQREAFMRKTIRQAQKEGFERIAVVCGAWHAPALADMPPAKDDNELLKGLPRTKVQATWIPWTYDRISSYSGYGAGVESPGWYHHLFTSALANHTPTEVAIHWMTRVARLLRSEGLDASSAHVIEAVRLAEALAALRDCPLPGLPEMNEAALGVFCFDTDLPLRLVHRQLIVGNVLGAVPDETPMVPLQQDLSREQKRLRLPPTSDWKDYDLDLRKPTDLERSHLLHRLLLLGVEWGTLQRSGGGKGTFHELWRVQWQPELAVRLIEAGRWGNTILAAATARTCDEATRADLSALGNLIEQVLLAHLPDAVPYITQCLENQAALTSDVVQMMRTLPGLANVLRYGDVRKTDTTAVGHVVNGLVVRICIGLPGACSSLNDEAAAAMFKLLVATNDVITMLQHPEHLAQWQAVLTQLANQQGMHGMIAGRCVRLLLDQRVFDHDEAARRMGLSLSLANEPAYAAAWIEGFIRGSGALLVHDTTLWQVLDGWVTALAGDTFTQILPLLRRTFATFEAPERRSLGERVRRGEARGVSPRPGMGTPSDLDEERARAVLPLVADLLGLPRPEV
ncbi:MAG: hypothetical protein HC884_02160 [Chloroflexaceae bacterium]|nr:hypothetical protein [Chloroflexaceae bacterium]